MPRKEGEPKIYKVQVRVGSSLRTLPVSSPNEISKESVSKVINGFSFDIDFREQVSKLGKGCVAEVITTKKDSKPQEAVGIRFPDGCAGD